jgi:hypothetical protein
MLFWDRTNPAQFLAQRECVQDVEYAIFAFRVPARGPVRIACLIVTSFLLFAYVIFATYELRSLYRLYRGGASQPNEFDSNTPWRIDAHTSTPRALNEPYIVTLAPHNGHAPMPISQSSSSDDIPGHFRTEEKSYSKGEKRRRCGPLDPFLLFIVISYCTAFAYLIASTEAMLFRNPNLDNEAREWGFGQVRSMFSL